MVFQVLKRFLRLIVFKRILKVIFIKVWFFKVFNGYVIRFYNSCISVRFSSYILQGWLTFDCFSIINLRFLSLSLKNYAAN